MIKFQKSTSYLMVLLLLLTCLIGCTPNADQLGESPSEGGEETTKDTITLLIQSEPAGTMSRKSTT